MRLLGSSKDAQDVLPSHCAKHPERQPRRYLRKITGDHKHNPSNSYSFGGLTILWAQVFWRRKLWLRTSPQDPMQDSSNGLRLRIPSQAFLRISHSLPP